MRNRFIISDNYDFFCAHCIIEELFLIRFPGIKPASAWKLFKALENTKKSNNPQRKKIV